VLKGRRLLPSRTVAHSPAPEPRPGTLTPIRDYSLVEGVTSPPHGDTLTQVRDYF